MRSRPPTPPLLRAFLALVPVVLATAAALTVAAPAGAATPCGKQVLNDWFDNGRIDKIYPLHCYEEGIDAIPPDLVDYANADEVITRALQNALRGVRGPGGCDPSPDGSANDCKQPANGGSSKNPGNGEEPQTAPPVDTAGTSSVPIPLLVLGGMSLALLAAGGLGYLSRRRRAAEGIDADGDDALL